MLNDKKLSVGNYAGYTLCDFGNNLAFCVISSYLAVYCQDILGISGWVVSLIMIIARIWDGINDPIMGFLVQSKKPGKNGKYRPFIIRGGFPLAISAILVFVKLTDSLTFNTIWVGAAYILYGMLYTVLLVPYGSLASVMTTKDNERNLLSVCRSIGGGCGSVSSILFPILVCTAGADGNQLDEKKLMIAMCIIAACMVSVYSAGYKLTSETVTVSESAQKISVSKTLSSLIRDRAFVTMSLLGCLLIAVQQYIGTVNIYLFKDYFAASGMNTVYMVVSYAPMVIMIPFINKIIKKFGKKEITCAGLAVSTLASFLTFALHLDQSAIWVYIILALFVNTGIGFLTLEIWSMVTDIIDHQEWVTGRREEAANYAVFTFMRKLGQALAALAPAFVGLAGYDSSLVGVVAQSNEVLNGMYTAATLVPFIMFAVMLALSFAYPLSKSASAKMRKGLEESRALIKQETV